MASIQHTATYAHTAFPPKRYVPSLYHHHASTAPSLCCYYTITVLSLCHHCPAARPMALLPCVLLPCILLLLAGSVSSQQEFGTIRSDLPHIRCAVCEEVASSLIDQSQAAHTAAAYKQRNAKKKGSGKASEDVIGEIVESICDEKKKAGGWIKHLDVVQRGGKLRLDKYQTEGYCRRECRTIKTSCETRKSSLHRSYVMVHGPMRALRR